MKQVTLNIPENQFSFFMKLVRSLNFVQVAEPANLEDQLNPAQKETWRNIKTGFEELKEVEQGKRKARKVKPSDFFGTLSKEEGEKMQNYITQSRSEWERTI